MEKTPKTLRRNNVDIVDIFDYALNNGIDSIVYVRKDKHHKVLKVWFKKDKIYKYFSITKDKVLVNRALNNISNKCPSNPRFKTLYYIEKKFYHNVHMTYLYDYDFPTKEYIQSRLPKD